MSISVATVAMSAGLMKVVLMDPCENAGHADEIPVAVGNADDEDESEDVDDLDEDEDQDDEDDEELDDEEDE